MDTLVVKLVLTPALIGAASLAGRRFGSAVGGWLVGFPMTSAPIALFLALGHGPAFAASAATGAMAGALSQAAFCLTWGWLAANRRGWPIALAGASAAFGVATAALRFVALPPLALFGVVVAGLIAAVRLMPGTDGPARRAAPPPRWDLPARMIVATTFVIVLTGVAGALGPRLTGLLSPFPLYGAVLAGFAHAIDGPASATAVLRGLLLGLFAFSSFFLVLALALDRWEIAPAFAAALAVTMAVQGVALWRIRARARAAA